MSEDVCTGANRRVFLRRILGLAGLALALPGRLLAAWPETAFKAETVAGALDLLAAGAAPQADARVRLTVPQIAENGALVPVEVSTDIANVSRISILVEKNPSPLAASFEFTPAALPAVSIRLKMNETSRVIAAVEADGRIHTAEQEVKVTLGGCGG